MKEFCILLTPKSLPLLWKTVNIKLTIVKSYGTEGRNAAMKKDEIAASDQVFDYIIFRGSDIKDLNVCEHEEPSPPPKEPEIVEQHPQVYDPRFQSPQFVNNGVPMMNMPYGYIPPYMMPPGFAPPFWPHPDIYAHPQNINPHYHMAPNTAPPLSVHEQVDQQQNSSARRSTSYAQIAQPPAVAKTVVKEPKKTSFRRTSRTKFHEVIVPKTEFNFEEANSKFEKKVTLEEKTTTFYSKSSFFDNISCQSNTPKNSSGWYAAEEKLNFTTFGTNESGFDNSTRGRGRSRGRGRRSVKSRSERS